MYQRRRLEDLKGAGDIEHGAAGGGFTAERIVGRKHQQRSQAFAAFAAGHRLMGHRVHDIAACFGHRGILGHGGPRPHQGDDAWLDFRTVDVGYAHSF